MKLCIKNIRIVRFGLRVDFVKSKTQNPKAKMLLLGITLPVFLLFTSGCSTLGMDNQKSSELFSNVNMIIQQNEILQASIEQRDEIVIALSDRLNKLADKLETVLAERKELESRIENKEEKVVKLTENIEELSKKNQKLVKDLDSARKDIPSTMTEVSEMKGKIEFLSGKLRDSQKATRSLGTKVAASIKMTEMYQAITKKLNNRILTGDVVLLHNQTHISIRFPNVNMFGSGKAVASKEGRKIVKEVASALKDARDMKIQVYGFTDNVPVGKTGPDEISNNQELSQARAEKVRDILSDSLAMSPSDILARGLGEGYPITENSSPVGKMKNRRIVIMLTSKSPTTGPQTDAFLQFEKEGASGS